MDTKTKHSASRRTRKRHLPCSIRKRERRRSTSVLVRAIPRRQGHSRRNEHRYRCIQHLRPLFSPLPHVQCPKYGNDPARTRQRLRLPRHDEHKTLLQDPHPAPRRRHNAASLPHLQPQRHIQILEMAARPTR